MRKILIGILCIMILGGCGTNKKSEYISKIIGIEEEKLQIIKEKDTHSGFMGDGNYFAKVKCKDFIVSDNWKKLPLTDSILEVLNMEHCDKKDCKNVFDRYDIPKVEDGYYYFVNRHSNVTNRYDSTNLGESKSYNFTIAIYDNKTKMMYFYELDT